MSTNLEPVQYWAILLVRKQNLYEGKTYRIIAPFMSETEARDYAKRNMEECNPAKFWINFLPTENSMA